MKSRGRVIFAAAAGLSIAVVATFFIEETSPVKSELGSTREPSTVAADHGNANAVVERPAEQTESRDPSVDEHAEQADGRADSQRSRESGPEQITAGSVPLEQNSESAEQKFASEGRDPDWSSGMEARILAEISKASGFAASVIEVDCHVTRCRLQLTFPQRQTGAVASSDDGAAFSLAAHLGLETEQVFVTSGEPAQIVFYLRRSDGS